MINFRKVIQSLVTEVLQGRLNNEKYYHQRRVLLKKILLSTIVTPFVMDKTYAGVGNELEQGENKVVDNNERFSNNVQITDCNINRVGWENKELVSIQDFMSDYEIADANSSRPSLDHSKALIEALRISPHVYFPNVKGYYLIKNVILPKGCWLVGNSSLPYTVNSKEDILGVGAGIVLADGGTAIFKFDTNVTFFGIVQYGGPSYKIDGLQVVDKSLIGVFRAFYCGFYGFRIAIGENNKYVGVDLNGCMISSNFRGVQNILDSKIQGGTINNNHDDGVNLQEGANDNVFINIKNEWNRGNNYFAYRAKNNVITSGICDRAAFCGVKSIESTWIVSGAVFRRNGSKAGESKESCHFYMEGKEAELILNGVYTAIGQNDNRDGVVSPAYSLTTFGSSENQKLIVSGSDLTGCTKNTWNNISIPARFAISGNIGMSNSTIKN
ncbi:hypothetical protein [Serratia sp. JSRIV006]|uniref:hypothetical protein n=1 Tax=Serratia sp. JSRIV006 TaxID=2831896 RepID=UPI001CC174C7|nr:hypothetical protein [Serratia sp. JSRIV006]UAN64716.1 hypothetical protein KGP16_09175 [Serratia sp. JSRIV006]